MATRKTRDYMWLLIIFIMPLHMILNKPIPKIELGLYANSNSCSIAGYKYVNTHKAKNASLLYICELKEDN